MQLCFKLLDFPFTKKEFEKNSPYFCYLATAQGFMIVWGVTTFAKLSHERNVFCQRLLLCDARGLLKSSPMNPPALRMYEIDLVRIIERTLKTSVQAEYLNTSLVPPFEWMPRKRHLRVRTCLAHARWKSSTSWMWTFCKLTLTMSCSMTSFVHQHIVLWHHSRYKYKGRVFAMCTPMELAWRFESAPCHPADLIATFSVFLFSFQLELPELRDPPPGKR